MSKSCVHLASDLHLGAPGFAPSVERERAFVRWMRDAARGEGFARGRPATEIHLVGDLFDFWFEYSRAVPKGGVRLMGAIAELADEGLPLHFHVGNHDMWTFGYLENELGVAVHREPILRTWDGLTCLVGHGDGLGPGDGGYRRLKSVFASRLCQAAFRMLHPDLGISLAHAWSSRSRKKGEAPLGDLPQEHLYAFAQEWLANPAAPAVDCFVFGHRHLPLDLPLEGSSARYLNTGDWLMHATSVVVEGGTAELVTHA
jgi:UDP-2,3-diacylglucosamine hydrolase